MGYGVRDAGITSRQEIKGHRYGKGEMENVSAGLVGQRLSEQGQACYLKKPLNSCRRRSTYCISTRSFDEIPRSYNWVMCWYACMPPMSFLFSGSNVTDSPLIHIRQCGHEWSITLYEEKKYKRSCDIENLLQTHPCQFGVMRGSIAPTTGCEGFHSQLSTGYDGFELKATQSLCLSISIVASCRKGDCCTR